MSLEAAPAQDVERSQELYRRRRRRIAVATIVIIALVLALLALLVTRKVDQPVQTSPITQGAVSVQPPEDFVWTPLYAREPVPVGGTDHPLGDLSPGGVLTQMMADTFEPGFVYEGKEAAHAVFTLDNGDHHESWSIAKWDTRRPYISFPVPNVKDTVKLTMTVVYSDGSESDPLTLR